MFCKFKHWSQRLLERGGPTAESVDSLRKEPLQRRGRSNQRPQSLFSPATTSATSVTTATSTPTSIPLQLEQGRSVDPRELPRPAKYGLIRSSKHSNNNPRRSILRYCYMNPVCQDNNSSHDQDDHYLAKTGCCTCANCRALPTLTECGICLEPLQGHKVHSCPICANLTCRPCASKLENCPFCRTTIPSLPNTALERLLDRLALPCKNSRSGCTELLDADSRKEHEAICSYGTFSCPVGSHICGWHGDLIRIEDHLKKSHDIRPIIDNGIAVEISGFRGKAYANDGRQYTVCLSCHQHLYVVKIVLFQGKLRLSFSQLGSKFDVKKIATDPARTYGVWIEIGSTSKVLKGALPFGNRNCDTREIEIKCDTIVSRDENDSGGSVKINIVIKPITVV